MPSARSKIWRVISLIFTVGGLTLIGAGGWMFYRQQVEANKPPPARILEVSIADLEKTPTPQPTPTPIIPTAVLQTANDTATGARPPASPTLAVASTPDQESASELEVLAAMPEPVATSSPTVVSVADEAVLSLADNPLLVVEEEEELSLAEAQPAETGGEGAAANATARSGSPLTRIVAESINLDAEVTEVGWQKTIESGVTANVWVVADYAAGWHRNSKLPGQGGNIVLSAHHNIKGEVFRYTVDLEPGDIVTLYDEVQSYDYVVEDKFIVKDKGEPLAVRHENAKWIGSFNEERLTLVTCWPYNNNTHRIIVIAKPVGSVVSNQ